MKQKTWTALTALVLVFLPLSASAHQHASYSIGGVQYDIVIGSLNEPITVDDKTGVDLRITSGGRMQKSQDGEMEPTGGKPAVGLEKDLQVELIAGDKKLVQELRPAWGAPGSYETVFYPTVATTISYRLFGKIEGTPVDLIFTCRAEGAEAQHEGEKEISPGVKQLKKGGGFGCPREKEVQGFPEKASSLQNMTEKISSTDTTGRFALVLSVLSLIVAGFSLRKKSH
jgi:hypothetical protein